LTGVLNPGVVKLYRAPARVDIELPTEVVDYYRVFPAPLVTNEFVDDIVVNGIENPIRIYTNGTKAVLRDGHHRLVAAQILGMDKMPVHIVPDWLQQTYVDYELPELEPRLTGWLKSHLDFTHQGHQAKRAEINKMVTKVYCSCGADWRETPDEQWEFIMGGPKK
jgi:hypothetical protein